MSISKTQTLFKDLKTKLRKLVIGTSHSIDDGNGSETVTENEFAFSQLCRVYSNSLKMLNLSRNFSADELLGTTPTFRRQRNDTRRRVFTSSISRRIYKALSRRGRAGTAKKFRNVQKSVLHVQNYCFA